MQDKELMGLTNNGNVGFCNSRGCDNEDAKQRHVGDLADCRGCVL